MVQQRPVALVTGGARRVGRAVVERLAGEGYDVAFTYRSSVGEAEELVGKWRGVVRVVGVRADLSKPAEAVEVIGRAFEGAFNRLDVLVNNASVYRAAALGDTDAGVMREVMAVHFESPLLLCQRFESMLRVARGHVVNMLDLLGERPWPKYLAYCASKAALWNLTLGLARELAPEVTVNGIAPGVVEWPEDYPEGEKEKYLKRVPLGRAGRAEDVAEAVVYFAKFAPYVTGQVLRVDGGRSVT